MTTTEEFDPFQYHRDIKEHPEKYISMAQITADVMALRKIKAAHTLKALKEAFQGPAKAAKLAGDTELLQWLTDAAKARKAELEKA